MKNKIYQVANRFLIEEIAPADSEYKPDQTTEGIENDESELKKDFRIYLLKDGSINIWEDQTLLEISKDSLEDQDSKEVFEIIVNKIKNVLQHEALKFVELEKNIEQEDSND